jgi:energy-coupling factor transport system substrate-specific component
MNSTTDLHRPGTRARFTTRWRVVDIVVASVLGVAGALIYFAWNALYGPVTKPLELALPGSQALLYGVWLFAGVLGGIVIRKPGAALFTELVAAVVSALLGAQWGFLTIESGLVQGLGAEIVFLIFLYSVWRVWVVMLAGAASGLAMAVNDLLVSYPGSAPLFATAYTVGAVISGAVIAGLGSWLILRGLAKTGVLSRFASGRVATAQRAV